MTGAKTCGIYPASGFSISMCGETFALRQKIMFQFGRPALSRTPNRLYPE